MHYQLSIKKYIYTLKLYNHPAETHIGFSKSYFIEWAGTRKENLILKIMKMLVNKTIFLVHVLFNKTHVNHLIQFKQK